MVTKTSYYNSTNQPVVETYTISGMGHVIAVDPGTCYQQGGTTGTYALDVNLYSSFWAAYFFNILQTPSVITGSISVSNSAAGITYIRSCIKWVYLYLDSSAGASILLGKVQMLLLLTLEHHQVIYL